MDKPELEAEKSQDVIVPIGASLKETVVTVSSPEGVEEFSLKGYGVTEDDKLRLTFYFRTFLNVFSQLTKTLGSGILFIET